MSESLKPGVLLRALDFAYEKAVNGMGIVESAVEMANDYTSQGGTKTAIVNSLVRWQNAKAATSGFLTGLPGLLAMPVTIPANITSVMFVQVRMIAAIAHIGGYDLKDDRVKSLVYICMVGNGAKDLTKDIGINIGKKIAENAIKSISSKVITSINQKVGFKLVTKFGEKGAINLVKAGPF